MDFKTKLLLNMFQVLVLDIEGKRYEVQLKKQYSFSDRIARKKMLGN